ncbi:MAG: PilZ domain-containing protein [Myxococcota bacterium]
MGDERRGHPRAALLGRATMFAGDKRANVPTLDVSETGLALRCPTPSSVGTFLRVNFRVSESADQWLDVDGVVRHMSPSHGGEFRYGIQFVSPSPACVAQVRRYVSERLRRSGSGSGAGARTSADGPSPDAVPRPSAARAAHGDNAPAPLRHSSSTKTRATHGDNAPAPRRHSSSTKTKSARHRSLAADQQDPELRRLYRKALENLDE